MTTVQDTVHAKDEHKYDTYDVHIEIACDCQELLDAIGLDYEVCKDDDTQNEVVIPLSGSEFNDVFEQAPLCITNECTIATALLNHELGECCTRVEALTPQGDKITFS